MRLDAQPVGASAAGWMTHGSVLDAPAALSGIKGNQRRRTKAETTAITLHENGAAVEPE